MNRPKYSRRALWTFLALHVLALGIFFIPFRWGLVLWLLGTYSIRMFGVTALGIASDLRAFPAEVKRVAS